MQKDPFKKSKEHFMHELNPAAVMKSVILIMAIFILAGECEVYLAS